MPPVRASHAEIHSHQLTWKCTDPCRKTTFLLERALYSMLVGGYCISLSHVCRPFLDLPLLASSGVILWLYLCEATSFEVENISFGHHKGSNHFGSPI